MKYLVSLLVVAALAVVSQTAVLSKAPTGRANLSVGSINSSDRLLHRGSLYRPGQPNAIQTQDYTYRGNSTTRISAVRATESGYTQYAYAWIVQGGVGSSNVTVRVQSARGYGYNYIVEVWGR